MQVLPPNTTLGASPVAPKALPPNPVAAALGGKTPAVAPPVAAAPASNDLTGIATHIATNNTYSPAFVKALQDMQQHDPTFQSRLNAEVNRVTQGIEAQRNGSTAGLIGNSVYQAGNPIEWVKGAIEGAPHVAHGVGKIVHGNIGGGAAEAGLGAVSVAGVLPFGRVARIGAEIKAARDAEEAAQHVADASQAAKIEGFGGHVGGKGHPPLVARGVATPETGGELGQQIREALAGGKRVVTPAREIRLPDPATAHLGGMKGLQSESETVAAIARGEKPAGLVGKGSESSAAIFKQAKQMGLLVKDVKVLDTEGDHFTYHLVARDAVALRDLEHAVRLSDSGGNGAVVETAQEAVAMGRALGYPEADIAHYIQKNDLPSDPSVKLPGEETATHLLGAAEIRTVQKAGYSEERANRVAAGSEAHLKAGGGIAGHLAAMRHQEGSMGAEFFGHLKHFTPEQVDEAARVVDKAPLQFYEQRRAVAAIRNAVDSGITPTESDQALLERVFGKVAPEATPAVAQSKGDVVRNLLNVPRALKSTLDFSAPFRQGLVMGVHNPKAFAKAFGPMFKAWMSEDNFQQGIMDEIHSRPTYPLMDKAGVPFTEIGKSTKGVGDISAREEAFMTNYAERLPGGIGNIVRRSDRAYVGFLDRVRADAFDSLASKLAKQGWDLNDEHLLHSMGDFIGSASGRGNLPALQAHAASLNALLFSPRLMMSRLNFLGFGGEGLKSLVPGSYYMSLHPAVRVEAWKTLIGLGATAASILELAKLGGLKVVSDPTNADFGKVKAGNTRFDILGGFQQYIRLGAELSEQKITSSTNGTSENLGSGFGKSTTMDILKRFFEGKLSPVPSAIASAAEQSSFTGSVKSAKFWKGQAPIPFMAQDVYEALRTPGVPLGAKVVGPVVDTFGVGMQSYAAKAPKVKASGGGDSGYGDQGSGYGDTGSYGDNSTGGYGG